MINILKHKIFIKEILGFNFDHMLAFICRDATGFFLFAIFHSNPFFPYVENTMFCVSKMVWWLEYNVELVAEETLCALFLNFTILLKTKLCAPLAPGSIIFS